MRTPPPVDFACVPSRAWDTALAGLAGLALAAPAAWGCPRIADLAAWPVLGDPAAQALVAVMAGLAGAALARRRACRPDREHTLRWDGQDWVLPGLGGQPDLRGDADLMLDLGSWLLVRFRCQDERSPAVWLPISLRRDAARGAMLRGALWNQRGGSRA